MRFQISEIQQKYENLVGNMKKFGAQKVKPWGPKSQTPNPTPCAPHSVKKSQITELADTESTEHFVSAVDRVIRNKTVLCDVVHNKHPNHYSSFLGSKQADKTTEMSLLQNE